MSIMLANFGKYAISDCPFILLFVHYCNVMVYVVYCVTSGKQEKVQACLVTLWLFIISCHSLYKTTLGSLCSWKPAWSLKKRPHSMCLKPFVKMCIFVVIQIFWSLRKYREQWWWWWWWWWWWCHDGDGDGDDDPCKNALTAPEPLLASVHSFSNISTILVLKNT